MRYTVLKSIEKRCLKINISFFYDYMDFFVADVFCKAVIMMFS